MNFPMFYRPLLPSVLKLTTGGQHISGLPIWIGGLGILKSTAYPS